MPERPALEPAQGRRLTLRDYRLDFRQHRQEINGRDSWKLERRQHFREPGDPSWEAFQWGEWSEALRVFEGEREGLFAVVQEDRKRGSNFHRVRVVAEPLTPYMQWELHALRVQAECGRPVRVVRAEALSHLESESPLPEVVVLGGRTLYEVVYTDEGVLDGGVRFDDAAAAGRWEEFIMGLYQEGEDMLAYAERYLNHLPPPQT